jgi:hypothetical protein
MCNLADQMRAIKWYQVSLESTRVSYNQVRINQPHRLQRKAGVRQALRTREESKARRGLYPQLLKRLTLMREMRHT